MNPLEIENALLKAEIRELRAKLYEDALTGVSSIFAFREVIDNRVKDCTVIALDIKGLKECNNRWGHEAGDALIIGFTEKLSKFFRKTDIYRRGGDEFIVVLENHPESMYPRLKDLESIAHIGISYSNGREITIENLASEAMFQVEESKRLKHGIK